MKAHDFPPDLLVAWAADRDVGFGVGSRFFLVATLAAPIPISEWTTILGEEWREGKRLGPALEAAITRVRAIYGVDDEFDPPLLMPSDTDAIFVAHARDE